MKPLTMALFLSLGAELHAQTLTLADSAAIRKAAIGRDGGNVMFMSIDRDTAIVFVSTQREIGRDTTYEKGSSIPVISEGLEFQTWQARVERRKGKWVRVSRRLETR